MDINLGYQCNLQSNVPSLPGIPELCLKCNNINAKLSNNFYNFHFLCTPLNGFFLVAFQFTHWGVQIFLMKGWIYIWHGQTFLRKYLKYCFIPVWLRNRLISAGLEPVLSHTEKLCIVSYYIQFSSNIKM